MPVNIRPVVSQGLGELIKHTEVLVLTLLSFLLYRLLRIWHYHSCRYVTCHIHKDMIFSTIEC